MKRMKKKILMIFAVLLVIVFHSNVLADNITSVTVVPSQPLNTDLITFNISGTAASTPSWVASDIFSQNGTSLQLDLYVDMGYGQAFSNWNYSKQIQPLAVGTYSLEVRELYGKLDSPFYGMLLDTDNTSFTVTPEPASAVMLGIGAIFLASRRKQHHEFGSRVVATAGKPATGIAIVEKKTVR